MAGHEISNSGWPNMEVLSILNTRGLDPLPFNFPSPKKTSQEQHLVIEKVSMLGITIRTSGQSEESGSFLPGPASDVHNSIFDGHLDVHDSIFDGHLRCPRFYFLMNTSMSMTPLL